VNDDEMKQIAEREMAKIEGFAEAIRDALRTMEAEPKGSPNGRFREDLFAVLNKHEPNIDVLLAVVVMVLGISSKRCNDQMAPEDLPVTGGINIQHLLAGMMGSVGAHFGEPPEDSETVSSVPMVNVRIAEKKSVH
jgi:hypothetical protein